MRRRSELKSIGSGVLHSFVSRNSDIDGYWSIGKLYSYANASGTRTVQLDLLKGDITPQLSFLKRIYAKPNILPLTTRYERMLRNLLAKRNVPGECLSAALVTIEFESARAEPRGLRIGIDSVPYLAALELVDDLGHLHKLQTSGWCRPHNPCTELASARLSHPPNSP